ncbi:MAG TPA: C39 family peptidase [Candidatus Flavonifractor merdigallinarum]|uniref:C39 family peptidase n=1 Tax=Candidatus Flavonifractor merdigallinarum TaxID=2838589 RepID=A0A9D1Y9E1_9FIRM|nr:C39 family peptidase [Candidatus Flavonifractor merdigallinarum]
MKKKVTLALGTAMLLNLFAGCTTAEPSQTSGAVTPSLEDAKPTAAQTAGNFTDEMKIPYAVDLSPEDGADSVERDGDHADSPYFSHPDFYNLESTDTLTILPHFKTIQQTSEWSCGVASALMVLEWYGKADSWNEENLAALRHELTGELADYPGTTLKQAMDIFDGVGGFDYITTLDYTDVYSEVTLETIQGWLAEGKPVMVAWNDWGGHWQVIIGYDTMGTETTQDDVIIVADPYDTTDHNQDGYGIYPAERFYYNFTMYNSFTDEEGGNDMLFIVPTPVQE